MTPGGRQEREQQRCFLIELEEKIAAAVCRYFQKRAVIKGSYGRKNPGDAYNKTPYTGDTKRQHKGYLLEGKKGEKDQNTRGEQVEG